MLRHGEIPAGIDVDVPSLAERRGVGFKPVTTATLTFQPGVAVDEVANWLYDRLCDEPTTRLTINRTEVRIAKDEIKRVLQEEVAKEKHP